MMHPCARVHSAYGARIEHPPLLSHADFCAVLGFDLLMPVGDFSRCRPTS